MDLTEDELKMAEDCGSAQMTLPELELIFNQFSEDELSLAMANKETPFYQAFHRGRLLAEMEVRQAIFLQAKNGSSPAQSLAMQLITDYKLKSA
jgi:hypothetical protein